MEEGVIDPKDTKDLPTTLSHSSSQTIGMCEQKYYFYKVLKAPHDPDARPDWHPFHFGSALHYIAEHSKHTRKEFKRRFLAEAMEAEDLSDEVDAYHLYACIMAYYAAADRSGLEIVICELEIKSHRVFGKIDAIGIDKRGRFWIVDLKTTGWWKDLLPTRLTHDPQLNLYAAHLAQIVEALRDLGYDVDLDDFAGVVYRAVCKTKLVPGYRESLGSFCERADIRCYFMHILKEDMNVEAVTEEHRVLWQRAMELGEGVGELDEEEEGRRASGQYPMRSLPPRRNYSACLEFNHPCEYWSRCYGCTATESKTKVHMSRTALRNKKTGKVIESASVIDVGDLVWKPNINKKEETEMLNVIVKETNWFPSEKAARVIVACNMGANEFSRPFYYETDEPLDANFMNECIEAAMKDIKVQFWIHLAGLRSETMYHHWCGLLGVPGIPLPKEGAKPAAPVAKEEPKPAAKPIAKEAVEDAAEEAAEEAPAKPAAKAAAKPAAKPKAPDEVVWVGGNKELSPLLMSELDEHLPKNWKDKEKFKMKAKEVSAALAKKKVVVLRDGEVTPEFKAMVEKLVDE